jgi:uncharacterized membrane protein YphA (DoxX/SURF4 family)
MSKSILILIARVLLSFIFIFSGFGKLADPAATVGAGSISLDARRGAAARAVAA